jgi:hypothetical protein
MTKNPNELTIEDSALLFIDHQPAVALVTPSIPATLLIRKEPRSSVCSRSMAVPPRC